VPLQLAAVPLKLTATRPLRFTAALPLYRSGMAAWHLCSGYTARFTYSGMAAQRRDRFTHIIRIVSS
jgi:hypothetical protein